MFSKDKTYTIDNILEKNYDSFVGKEEPIYSVAEVAERLGVTRARVNQLISSGRLPAQRIGRAFVIREADIALVQTRRPGRPPNVK